MNHSFSKSNFHNYCVICKRDSIAHTNEAICEACSNVGECSLVNDILLCVSCEQKEMDTRLDILNISTKATDNVLSDAWTCKSCHVINNILNKQCTKCKSIRPSEYDKLSNLDNLVLNTAKIVDQSIQVRSDLFNAVTVSIQTLKESIDADPAIENKHFKLAEVLKERFEHFQSVIFSHNEIIMDAANNQKAIQVYLNNLANKLRSEEREKLKLADISYQVKPVGPIKTPRINKPTKKFNKEDISKWCKILSKELGKPIPEFMLQTVAVSNNCDAEQAANILRKNIKESLSMNT